MRISENTKILNLLPPVSHATGFAGLSGIINMKNYANAAIKIFTGATSTSDSTVIVQALNGSTSAGTPVAIPFKYRYCDGTDDVLGDYVQATAAGFSMVASKPNSFYVIELKAQDLLSAGQDYSYVRINATAVTSNAQVVGVTAECYQARKSGLALDAVQSAST